MKKILIESCKECLFCAQYDNDTATCNNAGMGIDILPGMVQSVEVPIDGTIHADCPLEDDESLQKDEPTGKSAEEVFYDTLNRFEIDADFSIGYMKPIEYAMHQFANQKDQEWRNELNLMLDGINEYDEEDCRVFVKDLRNRLK